MFVSAQCKNKVMFKYVLVPPWAQISSGSGSFNEEFNKRNFRCYEIVSVILRVGKSSRLTV